MYRRQPVDTRCISDIPDAVVPIYWDFGHEQACTAAAGIRQRSRNITSSHFGEHMRAAYELQATNTDLLQACRHQRVDHSGRLVAARQLTC
jgi:hypothetical protein